MKKPQSGWSAPGFEPETSWMRVLCITTEPARPVRKYCMSTFGEFLVNAIFGSLLNISS